MQFINTGETTAEQDEAKADHFICTQILKPYYQDANSAIKHLWRIRDRMPTHVRETLMRRWEQIRVMIRAAFENGTNKITQAQLHMDFDA